MPTQLKTSVLKRLTQVAGTNAMAIPSLKIANMGLRGLGINVSGDPALSAESWFLEKLFTASKNLLCADVGANVGEYSAILVRQGAGRVLKRVPKPSKS